MEPQEVACYDRRSIPAWFSHQAERSATSGISERPRISSKELALIGEGPPHDVRLEPQTFGRFLIRQDMGPGRFGPLYLAHDPDTDRPVVVRTFAHRLTSGQRDALIAALTTLAETPLQHPSIARPIGCGVHDDRPYFVHDFLPGVSVQDCLRVQGPQPPAEVAYRITCAAAAIDFAAAAGVRHGALGTADVILTDDGAGVTGFGLAQALQIAGVEGADAVLTDDVEGLASVAYELLCGVPYLRQAVAPADATGSETDPLLAVIEAAIVSHETRPASALAFADAFQGAVREDRAPLTESMAPDLSFRDTPHEPADDAHSLEWHGEAAAVEAPVMWDAPAMSGESDTAGVPIDSHMAHENAAAMPASWLAREQLGPSPTGGPRGRSRWIALAAAGALACALLAGFAGGLLFGPRETTTSETRVATSSDGAEQPAPTNGQVFTENAVPERAPRTGGSGTPADAAGPPASGGGGDIGAAAAAAAVAPTGRLLIRSDLPGAVILVDGERRGSTPGAIRDLSLGTHVIDVLAEGRPAWRQRVTLSAERPSQTLDVRFERDGPAPAAATTPAAQGPGALHVDSRPAGADVFVDGTLVGRTPLLVSDVSPGSRAVRLEMPGYRSWSTTVAIGAGARARVAASLEQ